MRSAFPRLAGPSAVVLGSVAFVLPLVSGAPALGVSGAPVPPGGSGAVAPAQPLTGAPAGADGGADGGATLVAPAAAHPVTPDVDEVPIPDADRAETPHLAAISDPEPVTGYGIVGATWQGQEPGTLGLQVRTLDNGEWSQWQVLPWHDEHAPDPGTEEARNARFGSDPVVVGDVDQVQVRATSASGEAPRDLELSVVDPGVSAADDDPVSTAAATTGTGATTAARPAVFTAAESSLATRVAVSDPPGVRAPRPRIRSRKAWGANESLRSGSPSYGTVKAGFVHHTVNANAYTRAQVPAIIRGIYAYHTQSNGWSDIGYNFLVDRFGRIWQGRFGDITRNVIGAHTYGYNEVSFAMSAIGNFETAHPSRAMLRAYARLFGWKLGQYGIPAGARHRVLKGHTFRAINGHRDSNLSSTACPGRYLYAKIPAIRKLATRWQRTGSLKAPDTQTSPSPTPTPKPSPTPTPKPSPTPAPEPSPAPTLPKPDGPDGLRDLQADGFPDLLARDAATRRLEVLEGDGGPGFGDRRLAVQSVGPKMLFTGVGDVTGDGRPDLLVRAQKGNLAKVRPGRPGGLFGGGIAATDRFADADALAGVGQMTGNRHPDVVMRDAATGRVWIFPGQAGGQWGRKQVIIRNGSDLSMINGAGDLDGDGRNDILARDGRALVLYPGRGDGRVGAPRVIERGWGGKDIAAAGYDVTGDGRPDLVARDRDTHRTWIYVTKANGTVAGRFGGWPGWADLNRISALGDVTGDAKADLLGRTDSGSLMVLPSRGTRWLQGPVETGKLARGADFAQVVGDWNGDGHVDVVTRSNGTMWLYRGTGGGGLRDKVVLVRDWGTRTFLVGAGDMDRDGDPDLISRTPDGRIWVNASDSRTGMERRYVAREKMFRADIVTAAGYWNDDGARDLIVRRASTDRLYLVPGRADGTLGRPEELRGGRSFAAYDRIVGVGYFNRDRYPDIVARERGKGRLWLFAGSRSGLRPREYVASGMNRYDLLG